MGTALGCCEWLLKSSPWISPGNTDPSAELIEQGATAIVAAEDLLWGDAWMTATGWPRPEGSDWTVGLGSFVSKLLLTRPPGLLLSSSSQPPCCGILKLMLIRCGRSEGTYRRWELHPSKVLRIRGCLKQGKRWNAGTILPSWPCNWPGARDQNTIQMDLQPLRSRTQTLKSYLEMNLSHGLIQQSPSSAAAPIFFGKKIDNGLWLCIDYWALILTTVKNW